jgi:hypothetical protein
MFDIAFWRRGAWRVMAGWLHGRIWTSSSRSPTSPFCWHLLESMSTRALRLHSTLKLRCPQASNRRRLSQSAPSFNDTTNKVDSKVFAKTLLLPNTSFPLRTDPSKSEFRRKTSDDLYRWQVCVMFDGYHLFSWLILCFFDLHEVVGQCHRTTVRLPRWTAICQWTFTHR